MMKSFNMYVQALEKTVDEAQVCVGTGGVGS